MDIVVKWLGSVYDSRIFYNSKVNEMLQHGIIPSMPKVVVKDASPVPKCILGDPAYPLLLFLMKQFTGGGNTVQEQFFGWHLSSADMMIECAFGRQKTRFGALRREVDIMITDLTSVIYASFVLHNYCELNNETLLKKRIEGTIRNERECQPALMCERNQSNEATSKEIRKVLQLTGR